MNPVRSQFPMLSRSAEDGKPPLAYLDSAATTQKPLCVIERMDRFYREHYSTVKRGLYRLSAESSALYEAARGKVQHFVGAASEREIVFTRGTTEAINLVAWSWGFSNLKAGDEILVSALEHHANLVPWQIVAGHTGAVLRQIPCDDAGNLLLDSIPSLLKDRTRLVAVTQTANSIGTVNDIPAIAKLVRANSNALLLVDAAQSSPHMKIDVQAMDCDFLAFSGHKVYGPTGIGALYGRLSLLESMPPWHGGGDMIDRVTFEKTTFAAPPSRFEAGTPPIAEVLGFGEAMDFLEGLGMESIHAQEQQIVQYALERLQEIAGLRIVGTPQQRGSVISFILDCAHAHDAALVLDEEGVAVRSGHHCAQPVMDRFGVPATIRASFGVYSERWEVDQLVAGLQRVIRLFS